MTISQKQAVVQPEPAITPHEQKEKNLQAKIERLSKLPSERKDVKIALARAKVHLADVQKKIKSS